MWFSGLPVLCLQYGQAALNQRTYSFSAKTTISHRVAFNINSQWILTADLIVEGVLPLDIFYILEWVDFSTVECCENYLIPQSSRWNSRGFSFNCCTRSIGYTCPAIHCVLSEGISGIIEFYAERFHLVHKYKEILLTLIKSNWMKLLSKVRYVKHFQYNTCNVNKQF